MTRGRTNAKQKHYNYVDLVNKRTFRINNIPYLTKHIGAGFKSFVSINKFSKSLVKTIGGISTSKVNFPNGRKGSSLCGANGDSYVMVGGESETQIESQTFKKSSSSAGALSNDLNVARAYGGRFGTISSGLFFGGYTSYVALTNLSLYSEKNNSSNVWSQSTELLVGRADMAACGTSTSGILCGGNGTVRESTEKLSSTTWSESADMPLQLAYHSGCGTSTTAIFTGGHHNSFNYYDYPPNAQLLKFSSSSWSTLPFMLNIPRIGLGAVGTSSLAIFAYGISGVTYGRKYGIDSSLLNNAVNCEFYEIFDGITIQMSTSDSGITPRAFPGHCGSSAENGVFVGGSIGCTYQKLIAGTEPLLSGSNISVGTREKSTLTISCPSNFSAYITDNNTLPIAISLTSTSPQSVIKSIYWSEELDNCVLGYFDVDGSCNISGDVKDFPLL